MSFKDVYEGWKSNPEGFWMKAAESIDWIKPPSKALWDDDAPFYEWFKDAKVNTCFNAVDRHVVSGCGDQIAIIYDSPLTNKKSKNYIFRVKIPSSGIRRGLGRQGNHCRGPSNNIYAYGTRGSDSYACLCSNRCNSFSCIRWASQPMNSPSELMMPHPRQ